MGQLRVMGKEGDVRTTWDPNNANEVEQVRRQFQDLTARGYNAYSVKEDGGQGEVVREFDPAAAKLILAMPMQGG